MIKILTIRMPESELEELNKSDYYQHACSLSHHR